MRSVIVLAALVLQAPALAADPPAASVETRDYLVASQDPGILVSVRFKSMGQPLRNFDPRQVVVLVHGATLPSRPAFDPPLAEGSWSDWLARNGYAVYLMDVRNYGGSTREKAMDEPPDRNPGPSRSFEAVRDIGAVVDHVLARHGLTQVNLVGWSWGGLTAGHFASLHPEKVRRLVLYAPLYSGREKPEPFVPSGAYGLAAATGPGLKASWSSTLGPAGGPPPWPDRVLDAVAVEMRASDPTSSTRAPPTVRFPKGAWEDLHLARQGRALWSASTISADTLVIRGERDHVAPAEHADALMRDLTHARSKFSVTVPGGTHFLQFEAGRSQLFGAVDGFLRGQGTTP